MTDINFLDKENEIEEVKQSINFENGFAIELTINKDKENKENEVKELKNLKTDN